MTDTVTEAIEHLDFDHALPCEVIWHDKRGHTGHAVWLFLCAAKASCCGVDLEPKLLVCDQCLRRMQDPHLVFYCPTCTRRMPAMTDVLEVRRIGP